MPPSAMIGTPGASGFLRALHHGGKLGNADTGDDPRRADRARPDTDLDRIGPGIDQRLRRVRRRDVAGDHLRAIRLLLDARNGLDHLDRVPVRGIDDDHVAAGIDQPFGALITVFSDGRRRGDPQTPLRILRSVRMLRRLLDILDRDQADAIALIVDDDQLFDAVLMQQALGLILSDVALHRDQIFFRHQLENRLIEPGRKPHVAVRQNADELAFTRAAVGGFARAFHDRHTRNALFGHQLQGFLQRLPRRDRNRV